MPPLPDKKKSDEEKAEGEDDGGDIDPKDVPQTRPVSAKDWIVDKLVSIKEKLFHADKKTRNTARFQLLLGSIFLLFSIFYILGIVYSSERSYDTTKSPIQTFFFDGANASTAFDFKVKVFSFTPATSGASAVLKVKLVIPKVLLLPTKQVRLSRRLEFTFGETFVAINKDTEFGEFTVPLAVPDGSMLTFPFDVYTARIPIQAFWGTAQEVDNEGVPTAFNVRLHLDDVGPFNTQAVWEASSEFANGVIRIKFYRPMVSKIYPMVVTIGMWFIIASELSINYALLILRWKKVDNPGLLIFHGALLFALPSLRNSMPFSPPLGANIDFFAFYWAIAVAMTTLLGISLRYTLDSKPEDLGLK